MDPFRSATGACSGLLVAPAWTRGSSCLEWPTRSGTGPRPGGPAGRDAIPWGLIRTIDRAANQRVNCFRASVAAQPASFAPMAGAVLLGLLKQDPAFGAEWPDIESKAGVDCLAENSLRAPSQLANIRIEEL
eukprot:9481332-Pyramimonas_sp.AAC.1